MHTLAPDWQSRARESLWQQTHGWCAGVRLLLNDLDTNSNWSWLRAYLQRELLGVLSDEQREVLLCLAHLPRASAALCDSLWEGFNGGEIFRSLLDQSLFAPVERSGSWYRLIPSVAHILSNERSGAALTHLRLKACREYVAMGLIDVGIEQAVLAGQPETAISLMDRLKFDWIFAGRHIKTLMTWRTQLPTALLESTPRLIGLNTRALLFNWRLSEAQTCLAKLGNFLPEADPTLNRRLLANWQAMRGAIYGYYGNSKDASEYCQAALANLEPRDWRAAYLCYSTLARMSLINGAHSRASMLLEQATEQARRQDCLATELLLNTDHICLYMVRGETSKASLRLEESFLLLESNSDAQHSLLLGRLLLLRGELEILAGNLASAEQALMQAKKHTQANEDPVILHALLALAEVAACRQDFELARRHIFDAERRMHCGKVPANLYQMVIDYQQARLLVREGDWGQLLTLARSMETKCQSQPLPQLPFVSPALRQRCQLLMAIGEHSTGKHEEVRARLLRLASECANLHFAHLYHEVLAALARVEFELGRIGNDAYQVALQKLGSHSLIHAWLKQIPAHSAEATNDAQQTTPRVELTPKELAVLQLLAAGLSNQEIGDHLFISTNTVKTHTRRINMKLGVKRRTQAVIRAQAIGLL
ncbi:LuxR C-terminal-related transcriptional regulator [Pseudomonas sp. LS44]|uniref:helix-turn-helix transcriptional regulator n=1 Tax=Pseudomonas sp. LS44 TaxID=1357074 RepID=UPI00215A226C|nr:LuxR C-terminal-related transcriptional regulator [Pseudomonas sp. LS44]UVE17126.1 LuxR C-terminal-related transcriptional regulator [Pseudomonas sp. LS44]